MTRDVRRILLCSMAVPWPKKPLLCAFHHEQAIALRQLGAEMRLFSPAPKLPWALRFLHPKFRRHIDRPRRYEMNGVVTESPRCAFAFPPVVRHKLAQQHPEQVASFARATMGKALRRAIDEYQPDALVGHGMMPWGRLLQTVSGESGVPFSIIEHSASDVMRLTEGTPLLDHYREVAAEAERVLVVGSIMDEHLQQLGVKNSRLVPNGTRIPSSEQISQPRPKSMDGRTIVLSACHYQRRKGLEELLEGFSHVANDHPDAVLVLITEPGPELRRELARAHLGDRVYLLPPMSPEELTQWMVWADLFAMPSWSEAFGLVYVEALACGTPVLMTEDCGLAWQLSLAGSEPSDEQHGWVVPSHSPDGLASALDEALSDRERLISMGKAGRRYVCERFTWQENARRLLAAFDAQPPWTRHHRNEREVAWQ